MKVYYEDEEDPREVNNILNKKHSINKHKFEEDEEEKEDEKFVRKDP